jgi:DNA polymerase I-like protein with 3'-5' exonuclease and polymerase domains
MSHSRIIILDIETNLKHDTIWCCVTKDITTGEVNVWTEPKSLRSYLRQDDQFVGHNIIGFDAPILNRLWNLKIRLSQVSDTLIMSRLLSPSLENGHSLDAWGKRLGKYKGSFTNFNDGLSDEMIEYCKQDVEVTHCLYTQLSKDLKDWDQRCIDLEHSVAAIISRQERHGFKLDIAKAIDLVATWKTKLSEIEENLQSIFPPIVTERYSEKTGKKLKDNVEVFNPGSRQQIAERLMSLGWKPEKHTEKGSVIVDERVLDGIDIPEARAISEYLLIQKRVAQVSSWIDAVSQDGRVHGKVITNGAVTGRMTHHSPNMAQVPSGSSPWGKECRECWTVDLDNYLLVGADASGLELRMLAHYMKDNDYVREVCEGDIHTKNKNAAGLHTRAQAKTFIYAFLYGAGPAKIGSVVGGGRQAGQQLISSFLDNTPALKTLRTKVERLAEKGYLPGLDGRKLQVRSAHAALNTLLQGAGAIVMKQALVLLNAKIQKEKLDAHFVANVHDEWQIEVHKEDAETVGRMAVEAIKEAGEVLQLRCPLTGEYRIGKTWAETH